jgi:hypothetical protein
MVFWDVMLCNLANSNECFGGTCCLNFQDIIVVKLEAAYSLVKYISTKLHGVTSKKTVGLTLIFTDLITSNLMI